MGYTPKPLKPVQIVQANPSARVLVGPGAVGSLQKPSVQEAMKRRLQRGRG